MMTSFGRSNTGTAGSTQAAATKENGEKLTFRRVKEDEIKKQEIEGEDGEVLGKDAEEKKK
jgi:hypothetical protein